MKKLIHIFLIGICLLLFLDSTAADASSLESAAGLKGSGSPSDPYQISTYDDLCHLRNLVDSGIDCEGEYFYQAKDIVFPENVMWDPIGDVTDKYSFAGYYDGGGHVLENIVCEDPYAGLFAYLSGKVINLGIESGRFSGDTVGSITSHGKDSAQIVNCYNKADVLGRYRAGGITDNYSGIIAFCWNLGRVTGENTQTVIAGITAYGNSRIESCYSSCSPLVGDKTWFGVIRKSDVVAGKNYSATMEAEYKELWSHYLQSKNGEGIEPDISENNIVFLRWQDDRLIFDHLFEPPEFANIGISTLSVEVPSKIAPDKVERIYWFYSSKDGRYYLMMPSGCDLTRLRIWFEADNLVLFHDKPLISGNFYSLFSTSQLVILTCGDIRYELITIIANEIPNIFIDIASGNLESVHANKNNREKGTICIVDDDTLYYDGVLDYIHLRGNYTASLKKKPYNIKLHKKADLFDMGSAKKWCLIACYLDNTMIRNELVSDLASAVGYIYSQDGQMINLYINGHSQPLVHPIW